MFIVRGENVYPSAVEEVLRASRGCGEEYRIIVSRKEAMDELVIQAEFRPEVGARPGALDALRTDIEARLRTVIGVRATVQLVPPGQLERTEFKAWRVIDNRDLFRELTTR
ncbi:MAG: hypothetical protein WAP47_20160 [Candidatus Rokuibacteriota bacterium]